GFGRFLKAVRRSCDLLSQAEVPLCPVQCAGPSPGAGAQATPGGEAAARNSASESFERRGLAKSIEPFGRGSGAPQPSPEFWTAPTPSMIGSHWRWTASSESHFFDVGQVRPENRATIRLWRRPKLTKQARELLFLTPEATDRTAMFIPELI